MIWIKVKVSDLWMNALLLPSISIEQNVTWRFYRFVQRWHMRLKDAILFPGFFLSLINLNKFSSFVWNYFLAKERRFHQTWVCLNRTAPIKYRANGGEAWWKISNGVQTLRSCSVHITISWLRKLFVCNHFVFKSNQNFFHGVGRIPVFEHVEFVWINSSVVLVNTWDVDFGVEFESWWSLWIILTTNNAQHVNSIIEVCIWWSNDCSVPVCERLVVTCFK